MKFKNYINELAAKNVKVEVKQADNETFVTRIVTNPELVSALEEPSLLTFEFYARKIEIVDFLTAHLGLTTYDAEDILIFHKFKKNDTIWDIGFEDEYGNFEQVSKDRKTAIEVFAGVEESFKTFIKKYNPNIFEFAAFMSEGSRKKLYDLLAKRISKKGYDYRSFKVRTLIYWVFYKNKEFINVLNKAAGVRL